MVLSGVVPEIWMFGFLGAYFTHSLWFSLGLAALLWFMDTVVSVHRADKFREASSPLAASVESFLSTAVAAVADGNSIAEVAQRAVLLPQQLFNTSADLIIALNFLTPVSILFGILVGLTVVWAFQLPPLLDPEPWHVRRRLIPAYSNPVGDNGNGDERNGPIWVFNFSVPRLVFGAVMAAVAVNFLRGALEPEVSSTASTIIGIILLLLGLGLVLYTFFRWYKSDQPSDWLNLFYALALAAFMVLPALYDFLLGIRPHQGWIFQLGLLLVFLAVVLLSLRLFRSFSPEMVGEIETDVRYSAFETRSGRQWTRWLALYVPIALIYLVGWIRDEQTQTVVPGTTETVGDIVQVLLAVALASIIIEFVLIIWGYLRWQRAGRETRWVSDEDHLDDYVVLPRNSPLLVGSSMSNAASMVVNAASTSLVRRTASTVNNGDHALDALRVKK